MKPKARVHTTGALECARQRSSHAHSFTGRALNPCREVFSKVAGAVQPARMRSKSLIPLVRNSAACDIEGFLTSCAPALLHAIIPEICLMRSPDFRQQQHIPLGLAIEMG